MNILIKKQNNLVVMLGDNIQYVTDNGNQFYYSVNNNKPWEVQKIHIQNQNDFEIIDVSNVTIPDDVLDFKYTYDSNLMEFSISQEWLNNQSDNL